MKGKVMFSVLGVSVCCHVQETSALGNVKRWNYQPYFQRSVQNPLPGDKDGVMKEVLKDFPVLCFLLLRLLFCLCLGTSTTRSFFSPTALWLGGLSGFFCINGPISISSNWDFILKEKKELVSFSADHGHSNNPYLPNPLYWLLFGSCQWRALAGRVPGISTQEFSCGSPTFGAVVVSVQVTVLRLLLPAHDVVGEVPIGKRGRIPLHNQLGWGVGCWNNIQGNGWH